MLEAVDPIGGLKTAPALAVMVAPAVTLGLGLSEGPVVIVGGVGGGSTVTAEAGVAVAATDGTTTLHTTSRADGTFAVRVRLGRGGTWSAATSVVATEGALLGRCLDLRLGDEEGRQGERFEVRRGQSVRRGGVDRRQDVKGVLPGVAIEGAFVIVEPAQARASRT